MIQTILTLDAALLAHLIFFNTIVWICSIPVFSWFFKEKKHFEGSSIFAACLGWIVISYSTFFLSSILRLTVNTSYILAITVFLEVNFYLAYKKGFKNTFNIKDFRSIFLKTLLFILMAGALYLFTSHEGYVNGIERVMDFGFIKSISNTKILPAQDMWYTGKPINYYYFGHFLAYTILHLSAIPLLPGFFIANIWIYASTSILVFEIAKVMFESVAPQKKLFKYYAALLSMFLYAFSGPWYTFYWIVDYAKYLYYKLEDIPFFWYPESTRVISGTITEFPIYSYLEATVHAHTFGYLSGALVIYLLFHIWADIKHFIHSPRLLFLLSFLIGVAYITNSWDVLTLGIVSLLFILCKTAYISKTEIKSSIIPFLTKGLISFSIFIITVTPWALFYDFPVAGIGRVKEMSDFGEWFSVWGLMLSIVVVYMVFRAWWHIRNLHLQDHLFLSFIDVIMLSSVLMWLLMDTFYVKDVMSEGEWYRANTVFKISTQVWLWMSIISGPAILYIIYRSSKIFKAVIMTLTLCLVIIGVAYPINTYLYFKETRKFTGYQETLGWWQDKYPSDYDAYLFLDELSRTKDLGKQPILMEVAGESYKDNDLFAAFLGWPDVMGWIAHEWTWRGKYEAVSPRSTDAWDFYTGDNIEQAKAILDKYHVNYIVIGQAEKSVYTDGLQYDKIENLGNIIFDNSDTIIVEYKAP